MGRKFSPRHSIRRGAAVTAAAALASLGLVAVAGTPAGAASTSFSFTGGEQTYTVPSDGSVCQVTLDAAGANGGLGDFTGDAASRGGGGGVSAASVGGTGGTAAANIFVHPGDVIRVIVGGAGGQGADQSQAGGFGGGGNGGNGSDPGPNDNLRGGGGGGASGFILDDQVLLVAGGGGGGGAYNADGGDGGSAGAPGAPGEDVSSETTWGQSGGGGTSSAGGSGGATGVPANGATVGGDGSSAQGGFGGNGATTEGAGGGGGGGGGFFGGGGGGGASDEGSGGGGGGGSSFVVPPATNVSAGSLGQDADGNGAASITPVGTGCEILEVHKVVSGSAPAGTTFLVHVTCSTGQTADMRFGADNAPLNENFVVVPPNTDCTVQETDPGGAVSTSYECSDNFSGEPPPFCQPGGQRVVFTDLPGESAQIWVTNVMPAAAQAVQPRFTG